MYTIIVSSVSHGMNREFATRGAAKLEQVLALITDFEHPET